MTASYLDFIERLIVLMLMSSVSQILLCGLELPLRRLLHGCLRLLHCQFLIKKSLDSFGRN
jgi:hypothetical protein